MATKAKAKKGKKSKRTAATPHVRLFEDYMFGGKNQDYYGDTTYIGDLLNKKVSSLHIEHGKWQFFADKNYQKPVGGTIYPGSYARTTDVGIPNDSIASMKLVP